MNFKTTIVLVILLAGVLIGYFVSNRGGSSSPVPLAQDQPLTAEGPKLMDVDTAQVTRLNIIDSSGQATTLQKNGAFWAMSSPVASPANDWQVTPLLTSITGMHSMGQPSGDVSGEAGLDHPKYKITIETKDNKTITLTLGNKAGVGDELYAKIEGIPVGSGNIHLVDASIEKTLKTAADDVRDKHLVALKPGEIKQFKVMEDGKTIAGQLVNGKWQITQPEQLAGDSTAVSGFIQSILDIEATKFVKSDDPMVAFAGFDKPYASAWFSTETPSTQPSTVPSNMGGVTMVIGSPENLSKDHYLAEASGTIAVVDKSVLDTMKKTALDLRDRDLVNIPSGDVTQIVIVKEKYPAAPASTTPSTKESTTTLPSPTSTETVAMVRRPPPKAAPIGPSFTSTAPSNNPSTMASTGPSSRPSLVATEPVKVDSPWRFADDVNSQTDDEKVQTLLAKFQPLHADDYRAGEAPVPSEDYKVTLTTASATYSVEFRKPQNGGGAVGMYNGLVFDVPPALTDALDADFKAGSTPAVPAAGGAGGLPPGLMPR